ncbi:hypothetical protein QE152_g19304 [Popillia japonica]|uniref:Uncharacterized protein n=1 Tax=Popillia japonica TaxID=7064 RepID=A0AAW1KS52_POPJA
MCAAVPAKLKRVIAMSFSILTNPFGPGASRAGVVEAKAIKCLLIWKSACIGTRRMYKGAGCGISGGAAVGFGGGGVESFQHQSVKFV